MSGRRTQAYLLYFWGNTYALSFCRELLENGAILRNRTVHACTGIATKKGGEEAQKKHISFLAFTLCF